jgi:predicted MFS family arabinose efflux permease
VWLTSGEERMDTLIGVAGFSGSLLFLIATKYLLRKKISDFHILGISVLSGLAFLLCAINKSNSFYLGLAMFLWTFFNGLILNVEYRKAICS